MSCHAAEAFLNQAETESDAVIYNYDPDFVDHKYELLNLKIIHRRQRTGFEETKDFPIRVNDLVAGRYQVRCRPYAAHVISGQTQQLRTDTHRRQHYPIGLGVLLICCSKWSTLIACVYQALISSGSPALTPSRDSQQKVLRSWFQLCTAKCSH